MELDISQIYLFDKLNIYGQQVYQFQRPFIWFETG